MTVSKQFYVIVREDEPWREFEQELGGNLVQVYDLSEERVRLDSTAASGYFGATELGLFQWGHDKDHRPDLAQVKVMLSTLDPLGLPVATEVVAGNRADDPLYIPAVNRVRNSLERRGLLYIGDCKMAAIETRGYIETGGDYYLCPLPANQLATGELESYLEPVWTGEQELTRIEYTYPNGEKKKIALGYGRSIPRTTLINGSEVTWTERQLVVQSLAVAAKGEKSLRTRLGKAQKALLELGQPGRGKKRLTQLQEWQVAVSEICQRYRVEGLLMVEISVSTGERPVRR